MRGQRSWSVAPWLVFVATAATMGGAIFLGLKNGAAGETGISASDMVWGISWLALPLVGALIASLRPGNRVGWLACWFGLPIAVLVFASEYAKYALVVRQGELPAGPFFAWLVQWPFYVSGGIAAFVFLLFPDGHLPSRRWRPLTWLICLAAGVGTVVSSFGGGGDAQVPNPLGVPSMQPLIDSVTMLAGTTILVCILLSLVSTMIRMRKASGNERAQLKWLLFGLASMFVVFFLLFIMEEVLQIKGQITTIVFVMGTLSPPAGIAVALLRHRLYDIDIVINKTIVYGALAAFITAVYVGVVVGIGSVVGSSGRPNIGLSLTATAIVAIAFQPVRLRVQRFANKLVYGERVTPYEAITGFSHRIAETLTFDQVLPQMAEAAAKGVGAISSRVTLIQPSGDRQSFTHGDASHSFFQVPVIHQGEEVGEIAVAKAPGEQLTKAEQDLLKDLASQAGLAMRNLRLTAELQAKLEELQASRKRIVKAQDEERRRMERDIHDGAQQQLVAMSVKLGMAKTMLAKDLDKTKQLLEQVKADTSEAVDSLRDLARGVFPQMLAVKGLGNAVQGHVEKMGIDATVEDRLDGARFDPEIEANIYFCIREALQNASKHAPGAHITISMSRADDGLEFSVKDDGPGFAPTTAQMGSGLTNMKDRVEALGGEFQVDGRDGTTVTGLIFTKVLETAL